MEDFTETSNSKFPAIIELNVGGCNYSTTLLTLTKNSNTMLAAMFSGNYDVQKDRNGRYFIDADGEMFGHILRYLRYNELPPESISEKIYNDACYFGIEDLIKELEKKPPLIGRKIRERFRTKIKGYDEFVNELIQRAANINHFDAYSQTSSVNVLLIAKPQHIDYPEFDVDHQCFSDKNEESNSDSGNKNCVELGPWSPDIDEDILINLLIQNLDEKKFVCNYSMKRHCHYKCVIPRPLRPSYGGEREVRCAKHLYTVNFHWSKM